MTVDPSYWRGALRRNVPSETPSRGPPQHDFSVDSRTRGRSVALALAAVSVSVSLIAIFLLMPSGPTSPQLPRRAPEFSLATDRGQVVDLAQFAGHPVVIHFIVLVCCSDSALEIGYMKEVEPAISTLGTVFISIAMKSPYNYFTPQEYRSLMRFNWTLALDLTGSVQRLYGAVETSTYVIDTEGMIRFQDDETTAPSTLTHWIQEASRY